MPKTRLTNRDRHSPQVINLPDGLPTLHLAPFGQDGSSVEIEVGAGGLGVEVDRLLRKRRITVEKL